MNKQIRNRTGLIGAICSSVVLGLSAIPQAATAQQVPTTEPTPKVNPCPSIFYQEPYNNSVLVPEGCPPNAITQQLAMEGQTPLRANSAGSTTPPVEPPISQQESPIASVMPNNGRVSVRLTNQTNAAISYQVIGNTGTRTLPGRSSVVLRDLPTPVTIAYHREDHGLLMVTPQPSSQTGMLSVNFNEGTSFRKDSISMRIQQDGSVFLN